MLPSLSDLFRQEDDNNMDSTTKHTTTRRNNVTNSSSISAGASAVVGTATNNEPTTTIFNHHVRTTQVPSQHARNQQNQIHVAQLHDMATPIGQTQPQKFPHQNVVANYQNFIHPSPPTTTKTTTKTKTTTSSNIMFATTSTHASSSSSSSGNSNNYDIVYLPPMHQQYDSSSISGINTTTSLRNLHAYEHSSSLHQYTNLQQHATSDNTNTTTITKPPSPFPNTNNATSQQLYFSKTSSIVQNTPPNKPLMHANHESINSSSNSINPPFNEKLHMHQHQPTTQKATLCNLSSTLHPHTQYDKLDVFVPLKNQRDAYIPGGSENYQNYQNYGNNSSTHSYKETILNDQFNNSLISEHSNAQHSKRKSEETNSVTSINSSTKKRKHENNEQTTKQLFNRSETSNIPPTITTSQQPQFSNNNSKNSKLTRLQKSPSASSDNSRGSSPNIFSTSNSLITTPQNCIQFMNFSISDKSKIKFVNARHQQIGINDGAWTEKEHADFMRGLNECGKGRWREIAEQYVLTRTRTQVASHARKYLDTPNKK